jgi:hypothetical protein
MKYKASGVTRASGAGSARRMGEQVMYNGTMLDDLMKLVEKTERELESREMLADELAEARVYTLIWNVPMSTPQRFLSQGVA